MIYVCMLSVKRERTKPFICNYVNMIFSPPCQSRAILIMFVGSHFSGALFVLFSASIHLTHSDGDFKQKV